MDLKRIVSDVNWKQVAWEVVITLIIIGLISLVSHVFCGNRNQKFERDFFRRGQMMEMQSYRGNQFNQRMNSRQGAQMERVQKVMDDGSRMGRNQNQQGEMMQGARGQMDRFQDEGMEEGQMGQIQIQEEMMDRGERGQIEMGRDMGPDGQMMEEPGVNEER